MLKLKIFWLVSFFNRYLRVTNTKFHDEQSLYRKAIADWKYKAFTFSISSVQKDSDFVESFR